MNNLRTKMEALWADIDDRLEYFEQCFHTAHHFEEIQEDLKALTDNKVNIFDNPDVHRAYYKAQLDTIHALKQLHPLTGELRERLQWFNELVEEMNKWNI